MPVNNVQKTMQAIRKKVSVRVNDGILAVVEQIKAELVIATPVDTGAARAGWRVVKMPHKDRYSVYEVVNDVPYISALNEGHSDQAPAHFIEAIALRYGRAVGQVVTYKDE